MVIMALQIIVCEFDSVEFQPLGLVSSREDNVYKNKETIGVGRFF